MKSIRDTENLIRGFEVTSSESMDSRIHDNVLQVLTKQNLSAIPKPNTWRIIMENIMTRKKVAVLCCVALVSVAAAMVGPEVYFSIYDTIQSFRSATVEQRFGELVELTDPMKAVHRKVVEELPQLDFTNGFEFVSLYADDEWALVVTTNVVLADEGFVEDGGRLEGPLLITLEKQGDMWVITDIDFEREAEENDDLDRFLRRHPNAVEIPLK